MHWNYRLMKRIEYPGMSYEETNYYVVEVFYNDDDSIIGWTEKEHVWGETVDEVRMVLGWMMDSLDKPILDEADLLAQAERLREMGAYSHEVGMTENGETL